MNIYLAGPMRGIKDFNFPAFNEAAEVLRSLGHTVFNPAEQDLKTYGPDMHKSETGSMAEIEAKGFDRRAVIQLDLNYIINEADAIALLPGWMESKGACAEYWTAQFLDLKTIMLEKVEDGGGDQSV